MGSFVKFWSSFPIILQLISHYKCYVRSLVFAKNGFIKCCGNWGIEGNFYHQLEGVSQDCIMVLNQEAKPAPPLLLLWYLFCCGYWTLVEDQLGSTVTWSTTPGCSRCVESSYDALSPKSKIHGIVLWKCGKGGVANTTSPFFLC